MPLPPLIPLRHFFDNPERVSAGISPDGRTISFVAPRDGVLNVWVMPRDGGEAVPVTDDRDRGVRAYFWSRDGRYILYVQDQGGDENYRVHAVDPANPGRVRDLTPFPGVRVGILAAPRTTPRHLLITMNLRDPQLFDVHRLNLASGKIEPVAENPGNILGWTVDREGDVRAAYAQTPTGDYELLHRDTADGEFRVIGEYANEDGGHAYAFTPDGSRLYVGSAKGHDLTRLVLVDPATGDETPVDHDDEADLSGPAFSEVTGELLATFYTRDRQVVHTFDDRFARDWDALAGLHDGDPHVIDEDAAESTWIVVFNDDRDPGATYVFDRATHEATFLFRARPWLEPEHLAPMTPVRVTSRDGLPLHCYLTLPVGVEPANLPLVLVVHGGPWARDAWGYSAEAQMLANRGYAVLQVNYRGSTGFGKAFTHAAEREFAGKMHDDLIDAVEWAVAEGYADRDRVGIYGGSYGGYAALVGVTFTPGVFAAAISYVGPSNLITLAESFPAYWRPLLAGTWFRYVGDPDDPEAREDMVRRSPITYVDRIVTPLLVVQGANDPRVTKIESDQIVDALRARGVDVEYIVKDDEGHGFVKPENRMDLYRAMERFFAGHLGGRAGDQE